MDLALLVSGAIALLGVALSLAFLPRTTPVNEIAPPVARKKPEVLALT